MLLINRINLVNRLINLFVFSERFGTKIITETVARVDLSVRPFKYWTEGEEEEHEFMTADT